MAAGSWNAVGFGAPAFPDPATARDAPSRADERAPEASRGDLWEVPFAAEDLYELRHLVSGWAAREGMGAEEVDELVLSAHELATNSVRHGGGVGMLRLWRTAEALVCEVQDAGRLADPSIGSEQPGDSAVESRGLWIARQLCDLVEIATGRTGTLVRLHKRLV